MTAAGPDGGGRLTHRDWDHCDCRGLGDSDLDLGSAGPGRRSGPIIQVRYSLRLAGRVPYVFRVGAVMTGCPAERLRPGPTAVRPRPV